jgi:hypothetical protein
VSDRELLDNASRLALREPAPPLDPTAILVAEFQYAQAAAMQATEDRARVTTYFLATAGSVVLALLGLKLEARPPPPVTLGFTGLFTALTAVGLVTLNQLAALRLAWRESCRAMNQVKDHFTAAQPSLAPAFRWTEASLPPAYKPRSISSQLAGLVAAVMGLASASALFFAFWSARTVAWPAPAPPAEQLADAAFAALGGLAVIVVAWRHYVDRLADASSTAARPAAGTPAPEPASGSAARPSASG